MKVWVKLLIGAALGIALAAFLPRNESYFSAIIETANQVALNIVRNFVLAPLLFFGLTIGIYELRSQAKLWTVVSKTFLVLIASSALVISLGVAVTFIFPPERIPIIMEEQSQAFGLEPGQFLLHLIPASILDIFSGGAFFAFPLVICAFLLAMGLTYDHHFSKPAFLLIDSFSRVFFHIAAFFSEILGVIIIAISAYWAVHYRAAIEQGPFKSIILLLLIFSLMLGLLILPAFLYFLRGRKQNPWTVLYGALAPGIAAFFSGDINFTLPALLHVSKANLGIKRRSASLSIMLFTTFGRSGSAMVAAVALIVIVKSYSILGIPAWDIIGIVLNTLFFMLLLGRYGNSAAFVCLAALCSAYGHGFENSYLILKPMAFFLIALGSFLDVMIAAFGSFIVAHLCGFREERPARHFV